MALTASQLDAIYQAVLFRPVDQAGIQTFANRTDISDAQVRQQIITSNEANANVSPVVRLFDAALNRVPDTAGLSFFVNNNRGNSAAIATQILNSQEFSAVASANGFAGVNGGSASNAAFVQYLFNGILGRTASAGEVSNFTAAGRTASSVLNEIANSNEAVNRNAAGVVTFLDSVAQGQANTGQLENQTAPGGTPVGGVTLTFEAANDFQVLNGTAGNDTFNGVAANVQATDTVNGGAGTDTVRIFGATTVAGASPLPTLNNVEILDYSNPTGALTVNAQNVTGLNIVVARNSTTGGTFNVKSGVAVGLDNVTTGTVNVNAEAGATSQTVFLANGSNTGALTVANTTGTSLTSLRLDSAGTAANTVASVAVAAGNSTLNVTGAQKLTITGALDTDITTVNASTSTGGVSLLASATDVSLTGGSGNDRFAFAGNLSAGDTVVGGAGTDTIAITGTNLTTANNAQLTALNTKVTGVEVLEFTDGAAATIAGGTGAGAFTNTEITKILFNTVDVGTDTVNNAGSARIYAVGELNTGSLLLSTLPNTNTVNVNLEGLSNTAAGTGGNAANLTNLTVELNNVGAAQTAVVNINSIATSQATGATTVANDISGTVTAVAGSTINITGGVDLNAGTLANSATVNASTFTGKLQLTGSTAGDTITIGSGGTTSSSSAGNPAVITVLGVNGGDGNDSITTTALTSTTAKNTITGGAGADSITLNTGTDRVVYTTLTDSTAATPASTLDTVTNFTAGTDKFVVATAPTTLSQGAAFTAAGTGVLATDIASALTAGGLNNAANNAANIGANNAAVVTITGNGAGTYLVINDGVAGYQGANDAVIKLAGLSGTLATGDFITTAGL